MTGQQLGHYQILEKLGEGGMGVVYKARDSHLDRLVVLKILPKGFIADEERRKRFRQEAKTASALNHPNIVTIYDIDRVDGVDFIAMEYIEGKTLDALIGKTGLRLSQALAYAVQIADAAAAAHGTRIIHRDLKPSNVMVTESGVVKVLDFGLAKQIEPAPTGPGEATRTEAAPLTEAGAIMGTPAYMSPEQAEGKNLDARSDIFSFGTILYEMLTGQRPFSGETNVSTMAAILREEPKPVTSLSVALPREVDRIVSRCLRKAPPRRFQTMGDLKVALEELREEAESGKLSASAPAMLLAVHPRRWPWVALAACGFAAAAVATWYSTRPIPPRPEYSFRQLTYDSGLTTTPAISRDGKLVIYASDRASGSNLDLFVQQVSGGKPVRLTDHAADDFGPTFSPDSTQIVFQSARDGGGLYILCWPRTELCRSSRPTGRLSRFSWGNSCANPVCFSCLSEEVRRGSWKQMFPTLRARCGRQMESRFFSPEPGREVLLMTGSWWPRREGMRPQSVCLTGSSGMRPANGWRTEG